MAVNPKEAIKQPGNLSERVRYLRDYYFEGIKREWNNEYSVYSTGTPWDTQFNEISYYIVPEMFLSSHIRLSSGLKISIWARISSRSR